ncbi:MAG: hypothetical protein ACYC0Q_03200 [Eubacteriales bacterium]
MAFAGVGVVLKRLAFFINQTGGDLDMAIFFIKGMEVARRYVPQKKDLYLSADDFINRDKCKKKKDFFVIKLVKKIKEYSKMK